ncbi:unnamed protein product [Rotaria sp. Silwood2]|nr:unnamed protein product [Rotaria sp. Silwood2]CAF4399592.1 unnamed protein product [Rotaria sp. Silwood2]
MPSKKLIVANNKKPFSEYSSPSTLEIVLDDQFDSDSFDEDSNSQIRHRKSAPIDDEHVTRRQSKDSTVKNSKSHRLIEKRRRDRMNLSLDVLLNLIPHKKPENQRRIEKTEIVEMATKYIRCLISSNKKSFEPFSFDKKSNSKLDAYRSGYYNGLCDIYEYIEQYTNDKQLLNNTFQYINEKEIELKDLIVIRNKKDNLKQQISSSINCDKMNSNDNLFSISDISKSQEDDHICQTSIDKQNNSIQQSKVPIFVLHPSGTHYIPMCIDSSIVLNAFNNISNLSQTSSINEQLHCHPVSIPVNFNPMSALSDQYELDIQNINVIELHDDILYTFEKLNGEQNKNDSWRCFLEKIKFEGELEQRQFQFQQTIWKIKHVMPDNRSKLRIS